MTLLEKFYEWWDRADFEDILMTFTLFTLCSIIITFLALMLIGLTFGLIQ